MEHGYHQAGDARFVKSSELHGSTKLARPRWHRTCHRRTTQLIGQRIFMHITTDKTALDIALIHDFLSTTSPWAQGIPLETVQRSIEHSLCFGGFIDGRQIAFARVVTDHATFAYLMDVFVLPDFRGRGYSRICWK
jgi:predicted GNAT family acetyltransferase